MKERPIIFNKQMVQALLAGQKTQTRRVAKQIGEARGIGGVCKHGSDDKKKWLDCCCPWKVGDRLWVRETWRAYKKINPAKISNFKCYEENPTKDNCIIEYRADKDLTKCFIPWLPSTHMPRWASRIMLEVTDVRVERLQEIDDSECQAEDIIDDGYHTHVWVIEFKIIERKPWKKLS